MDTSHAGITWPELGGQEAAAVTIVGLGPGGLGDLSLAAWQALHAARRIVVRTHLHPCAAEIGAHFAAESCDHFYAAEADFTAVYTRIADYVVTCAQADGGVVYAVPGHPWVGETTTQLILARAHAAGLDVRIVGGASFVDAACAALAIDALDGLQIVDAMLLAREHHPRVEVGRPLLLGQLFSRQLASDVKLTLLNAYPAEHPVTLVRAAGAANESLVVTPLSELDHQDLFDHQTSLYVPPLPPGSSYADLQEIVAHLRAPEGCPWDQEQTLESLRSDLLGEAVEVLEAIDVEVDGEDNSEHIAEELGDLLLLVTMLTQIAVEEGRFQMADVCHTIVTKLIRRHPHVFGDAVVAGVGEILSNWEAIKVQEKAAKGKAASHALDGVPPHLPALEKARRLQSKADKAGLLNRRAVAHADPALVELLGAQPSEPAIGELLWRIVALAHEHGVDAEDALRGYAARFRVQQGG